MSRSVKLRPWQHAALARFAASPHPDFLAVATPGAGKTTFALTALRPGPREAPGPGRDRRADRAPQGAVGTGGGPAAAPSRPGVDARRRRPAARHARRRDELPAGGGLRGRPARARPARRRRARRGPPRGRGPGLGREPPARVRGERPAPVALGNAVPQRHPGDPVRALRGRRGGARTSSTATATPSARAASCGPSTSRGSAARWSGARPTATSTPPRSTTRSRTSSPTSGSGRRSRSRASGCPLSCARPWSGSRTSGATSRTRAASSSRSTRTTPAASRRCSAGTSGSTRSW